MIDHDLTQKCPNCLGIGKTMNPAWYPLWATSSDLGNSFPALKSSDILSFMDKTHIAELDEPMFYVCKECNGTGKTLSREVRELLEYILS